MTNRTLNNGKIALYKGVDNCNNNLFEIPFKSGSLVNNCFMAVEVDGMLHTITDDGKPNNKILVEIQFVGVSRKDVYSDSGDLK